MFKRNESGVDRVIRLIAGAALLVVSLTSFGLASGKVLGIVLAVIGAILVFTAATGACLLYKPFGISTTKSNS
jgi:uncharacterized membrane protein